MSNWIEKISASLGITKGTKSNIPDGIWTTCESCKTILYKDVLEKNQFVCPHCNNHIRISPAQRIKFFLDNGSVQEFNQEIEAQDILKFKDSKKYKDRITAAQKSTASKEAISTYKGNLQDMPVVVAIFNFDFMGGSMNGAVGKKFTLAAELALKEKIPFICFAASGGARMQEGVVSLMQMAKTSAVLEKLREQGIPYISVLTNPTMGGVSASLAMLGDIIVGEPGATIGFSGARVIKQTVQTDLPEGFQTSEFLLEHGAIDMIINRQQIRDSLYKILQKLTHHLH